MTKSQNQSFKLMSTKIKQLDFSGQKIYVGIDVHRKHFTVSIQGEELFYKTFNQPPRAEILVDYLKRNYPGASYFAAYEAGFSGFWLHEELEKHGIKCIVVNACDIPTTDREKKQKRDPLDSRKISRGLKNGELQALYVPQKWNQEDRGLLRIRGKIVGDQTRCRNRIKAQLYFYGIEYPEQFLHSGTHWSQRFMAWLDQLKFGQESGTTTLKLLLKEATGLRELLLESNKSILKLSQQERYRDNVKILLSVPGVGRLTAMILLTELGDITRFIDLDHLCAYLGLMPNVYASGDKEIVGDITKRGNKHLRTSIIESSWVAVRNDPALSLKYHQLCGRMDGNKAIIRIARKLLNRIRYVLLNKEEYRFALAA
jgi:transposase